MGRGLKELAEKNIVYKSETSDKSYSFNTAQKLNTLLLRMIRRMGLIKGSSGIWSDGIILFRLPVDKKIL
ncbi:hypothetical protein GCWU000325_00542 [Alloprevotella tannerae ATCC 51259]|uniref:Uncharacterized protein n=1 Tax=Alloprevotella tannerae ATCC 51259 TaxID=626522 RepID=C9LEB6_9BACT|nr:hypothetical protein GCWU000325_00542 [Alloprevotella tannerae ATCC 51259]